MGQEFTERETPDFNGFGDLPEDLRATGPVSIPDVGYVIGSGQEVYGTPYGGGAHRATMEPIPPGLFNTVKFTAINYLPRFNFESYRSQRFFAAGSAYLPSDSATFVNLLVDSVSSPQTHSTGSLTVPGGYAAVITGLRQWVGDATAVRKSNGEEDDIVWRVTVAGSSVFQLGNLPYVISDMTEEAKLFIIVNERSQIQLSVKNNIASSSNEARKIPVQGALTGHWFPIDELDDIFRNS